MRNAHAFIVTPFVISMLVAALAVGVCAQTSGRRFAPGTPPIGLHPFALAQSVGELAGYPVNVQRARILWVIDQHAVVIESDSSFGPTWRDRGRVLVLVGRDRSLAIPRPPVAIAPVTIVGVARTLLGVQAAHDVPWPEPLTRHEIERLDIRAAILASSVQTADGVELTSLVP
jgi:hypothetical protein